jgi:hypothetical protein
MLRIDRLDAKNLTHCFESPYYVQFSLKIEKIELSGHINSIRRSTNNRARRFYSDGYYLAEKDSAG